MKIDRQKRRPCGQATTEVQQLGSAKARGITRHAKKGNADRKRAQHEANIVERAIRNQKPRGK